MRALIVIPARLSSQRLPRKVLLSETGKPMLVHVWEQARKSKLGIGPVVACNGFDIMSACYIHGISAVKTHDSHPNGTSRACEASRVLKGGICRHYDWDAVCVVQGDVPEIEPALIDSVIEQLEQHPEWDCATAAKMFNGTAELSNQNRVKVWFQDTPSGRIASEFHRDSCRVLKGSHGISVHIGIYCYRLEALERYGVGQPCEREQAESLEQLRALHLGMKIGVVLTEHAPAGIDTAEDYAAFVRRWKGRNP